MHGGLRADEQTVCMRTIERRRRFHVSPSYLMVFPRHDRQTTLENVDTAVHLVLRHDQTRDEPHRRFTAAQQQQAPLAGVLDDLSDELVVLEGETQDEASATRSAVENGGEGGGEGG